MNRLPSPVSRLKEGEPGMSWRVEILPMLSEGPLFQQYDRQQPWNSPKNSAVADKVLRLYRCPSDPKGAESRETSYVMLVGPGTVGGTDAFGIRLTDILAGAANTILFVEAPDSGIPWAEPRDLTVDEFLAQIKSHKGGNHAGRIPAAFCDGSVHFIRADVSPDVLRALADPNHDKPIPASEWE